MKSKLSGRLNGVHSGDRGDSGAKKGSLSAKKRLKKESFSQMVKSASGNLLVCKRFESKQVITRDQADTSKFNFNLFQFSKPEKKFLKKSEKNSKHLAPLTPIKSKNGRFSAAGGLDFAKNDGFVDGASNSLLKLKRSVSDHSGSKRSNQESIGGELNHFSYGSLKKRCLTQKGKIRSLKFERRFLR